MNFDALKSHKFRFACKEYSDKIIPENDFNTILEAARLSPSAIGLEPWNFLIVQNKNLRNKLKQFCSGGAKQLESASHFVIILARKFNSLHPNSNHINNIMCNVKNIPNDEQEKFKQFLNNFFDTRFEKDFFEKEVFFWAEKQCYIALANMLNTAAILQIDSCAIVGFEKQKVEQLLLDENILDIDNFGVSCMASFGYRKTENNLHKKRLSLNEIVKWV